MDIIQHKEPHLTRQSDLIPSGVLHKPIYIIGAGAIGSFTSLQLAKMGFTNQTIYDYDTVDVVNLSNQFYRHTDVGKPKVAALRELIESFTGVQVTVHNTAFEGIQHGHTLNGVVIAAADCMKVRDDIYKTCKSIAFGVRYLIDPRMSAETLALYCTDMSDMGAQAAYEKTLYSNEEAVQERCTAKATMYTVNLLSGLVAKTVKNCVLSQPYPANTQWNVALSQCNPSALSMTMYSHG